MLKDPNIIGQKFTTNSGDIITIIGGENRENLTIQFEDGSIRKNIQYCHIKNGRVAHPDNIKKNHENEINIANNGMKMTLIKWHDRNNIDIQFEDNTIVKHKTYTSFLRGSIGHPNKNSYHCRKSHEYLNITKMMNCGMKATIVKYNGSGDIDVQFEDNTIVKHKTIQCFQKGSIQNPNITNSRAIKHQQQHINETKMMNCGMKATIIKYRNNLDIDVQFEDGTIIQHKQYANFVRNMIQNPNYMNYKLDLYHEGETSITNQENLKITLIKWHGTNDIDIQFEDGVIISHKAYNNFKNGKIRHPYFKNKQFHSITLLKKYNCNRKLTSYDCFCTICNKNMLLTPVGLMQHHLTCQKEK